VVQEAGLERVEAKALVKAGIAIKQGHLRKNWKPRHFELYRDELAYYESKGGEEKGRLWLYDKKGVADDKRPYCEVTPTTDLDGSTYKEYTGKKHCLQVRCGKDVLYMDLLNVEQMDDWALQIRKCASAAMLEDPTNPTNLSDLEGGNGMSSDGGVGESEEGSDDGYSEGRRRRKKHGGIQKFSRGGVEYGVQFTAPTRQKMATRGVANRHQRSLRGGGRSSPTACSMEGALSEARAHRGGEGGARDQGEEMLDVKRQGGLVGQKAKGQKVRTGESGREEKGKKGRGRWEEQRRVKGRKSKTEKADVQEAGLEEIGDGEGSGADGEDGVRVAGLEEMEDEGTELELNKRGKKKKKQKKSRSRLEERRQVKIRGAAAGQEKEIVSTRSTTRTVV
jgi:hypothetical protein